MASRTRRRIRCGKVQVEFLYRKNASDIQTQTRNTPAGIMTLSTPEATALDLIGYERRCGGLDNVATVLSELSDRIDVTGLIDAAQFSPIAWTQRLGYILDVVGEKDKADRLAAYIKEQSPVRALLIPGLTVKGAVSNKRWQLLVNGPVEPD